MTHPICPICHRPMYSGRCTSNECATQTGAVILAGKYSYVPSVTAWQRTGGERVSLVGVTDQQYIAALEMLGNAWQAGECAGGSLDGDMALIQAKCGRLQGQTLDYFWHGAK